MSYHSELAGGVSVEQEATLLAGISEWEPAETSDKSLSCVSIQNSFPLAGMKFNKQGLGQPQSYVGCQGQAVPLGTLASLGIFWAAVEAPCLHLCPSSFQGLAWTVREIHTGVRARSGDEACLQPVQTGPRLCPLSLE